MAEPSGKGGPPPGLYDRAQPERGAGPEGPLAAGLSLLWVVLAGAALTLSGGDAPEGSGGLRAAMTALVLVLPVGMIWVVAMAARASRVMRDESRRLQAAIEAIRQAHLAQAQQTAAGGADPALARKLDAIVAAQTATEARLAALLGSPEAEPAAAAPEERAREAQPSLALGAPDEPRQPALGTEDFIRALNFPETAEDRAGFAALRRALRDRRTAQFVTAAQDVLTLLSQEGIYMDDFSPDRARPDLWRRFAEGERGRTVAALGGVHDRAALALAGERMKQDPIFRDAAHHFLRLFDQRFAEFAETASDPEISAFADTRTARAFMLLGRAAGTFD